MDFRFSGNNGKKIECALHLRWPVASDVKLSEYVGVSSSTVMTMPYCDVVSQEVSLGAEFLQAVQTSVPTDTLHEIFTNAVSPNGI